MKIKTIQNLSWSVQRGNNCIDVYLKERLMWSEQFTKEGNVWVIGKHLNYSALERYIEPVLREFMSAFKTKETKNLLKRTIDNSKVYDKMRVITNILYGVLLFEEAMEMSDKECLYVLVGKGNTILETEPLQMLMQTVETNSVNYITHYQEITLRAFQGGSNVLGYAHLPPAFKYDMAIPTLVQLFEE